MSMSMSMSILDQILPVPVILYKTLHFTSVIIILLQHRKYIIFSAQSEVLPLVWRIRIDPLFNHNSLIRSRPRLDHQYLHPSIFRSHSHFEIDAT